MIILKNLTWSNFFSYGDSNTLSLDANNLTQLIGTNGAGKSSIPLIIEELLYSKNSKGIKKGDILNRYAKAPASATLEFSIGKDEYSISITRKSTASIKLTKNGEDISSHTATNTLKTVEEILKMDFKTFSQLIYQSSTSSLQFLSATDTNRKKFLVSLFNLEKYLEVHEYFKEEVRQLEKSVANTQGSISTISTWLEKHKNVTADERSLLDTPVYPAEQIKELLEKESTLKGINELNSRIAKNNSYYEELGRLAFIGPVPKEPERDTNYRSELAVLTSKKDEINAKISKLNKLGHVCPTCMQEVDKQQHESMLSEASNTLDTIEANMAELTEKLAKISKDTKAYDAYQKHVAKIERYNQIIDKELPTELVDADTLLADIRSLQKVIDSTVSEIERVNRVNASISEANSKYSVIQTQLAEYAEQLEKETEKLHRASDLLNKLEVLKKSFSTSGLLSFKIEYLVKDLEDQINSYLTELSNGRFQLVFQLAGDKLNIDIIDNGATVTVDSLSAGELARVNLSTLLAIRKLMSAISSTRLNTLFLDEVLGVIDTEGKDKLAQLLLKEQELNTFIIDHTWTHPLVPKVYVLKENNVSTIKTE